MVVMLYDKMFYAIIIFKIFCQVLNKELTLFVDCQKYHVSLLTEKYEQSTTSYFFDENSSLTKYITLPMILKGRCSLLLQICNFKFIAEITHYLFFLNIIIFACFFICSILKTTSCQTWIAARKLPFIPLSLLLLYQEFQ